MTKVLLVDDDAARGARTLASLAREGIAATLAGRSKARLEGLDAGVDLVLAEVSREEPGIEELVTRLRGPDIRTGVVLIGEAPGPRQAAAAIAAGAHEYLFRPEDEARLAAVLRSAGHARTTMLRILEMSEEVHDSNLKLSRQTALLQEERERLERRNRELNLLHEVSMELAGSLDLPTLARSLDGGLRRLLPVDWTLVAPASDERPLPVLVAGFDPSRDGVIRTLLEQEAPERLGAPVAACEFELTALPRSGGPSAPATRAPGGPADRARRLVFPIGAPGDRAGLFAFGWTNGPLPDSSRRVVSVLASQASIAIAHACRYSLAFESSRRDPLTALFNRRELARAIERELDRSRRYGHPVSLLMVDVDRFKDVNDRHGHQRGDEVLRRVANTIARLRRQSDLVARYGGEEFAVLLPHTDADSALRLAERIRCEVAQLEGEIPVTVSIGVAGFLPAAGGDDGLLIRLADAALYEAKRRGRNQAVAGCETAGAPVSRFPARTAPDS